MVNEEKLSVAIRIERGEIQVIANCTDGDHCDEQADLKEAQPRSMVRVVDLPGNTELIPGDAGEPVEDGNGDSSERREHAHWIMSTIRVITTWYVPTSGQPIDCITGARI